jgi:hypothetical protein
MRSVSDADDDLYAAPGGLFRPSEQDTAVQPIDQGFLTEETFVAGEASAQPPEASWFVRQSEVSRPGAAPHPRQHRAHAVDPAPSPGRARGLLGVLRPVIIVLALGTIFVSVYLAAFHAPLPHNLPVAVVGSDKTLGRVENGLEHGLPGGFSVRGMATTADAENAISHRSVLVAYVMTGHKPELIYASANGPGVTGTVTNAFSAVAKASGHTLVTKDVLPAEVGDTRGLSVFYASFGVILAGFLFGSMTYQMAAKLEYRLRMLSLLLFGVSAGVIITLVVGRGFDAVPGSFVGIGAVIALMALASGGTTMALMRLFGPTGVSLAVILLLIFGNATGGGVLPAYYLPGWLHPLYSILPVGVGVRALQGLSYFKSDGVASGVVILAVWVLVTVLILYIRDVWSVRLRSSNA